MLTPKVTSFALQIQHVVGGAPGGGQLAGRQRASELPTGSFFGPDEITPTLTVTAPPSDVVHVAPANGP